jgi:hypothetical protein
MWVCSRSGLPNFDWDDLQNRTQRALETNRKIPFYIFAAGVPVAPEDTNGIPPFAEFDIATTKVLPGIKMHVDKQENGEVKAWPEVVGDRADLAEFSEFTFVFEYDGNPFTREFTKQDVQQQKELIAKTDNPDANSIPHVTKRDISQLPTSSPAPAAPAK